MLISHDARTREMAESLNIPMVDAHSAQGLNLDEKYQTADFRALRVTYQNMYRNYIQFLDENNLHHNLSREGAL